MFNDNEQGKKIEKPNQNCTILSIATRAFMDEKARFVEINGSYNIKYFINEADMVEHSDIDGNRFTTFIQ